MSRTPQVLSRGPRTKASPYEPIVPRVCSEELPAPVLQMLQERFGNELVLQALQGGGEALGELLAMALAQDVSGQGALAQTLLSNSAMQRAMRGAPQTNDTQTGQTAQNSEAAAPALAERPPEVDDLGASAFALGETQEAPATPSSADANLAAPPPQADAAVDEDAGWLSTLVRPISPELADVIERGLLAAFEPEIQCAVEDAVEQWFGELEPDSIATSLLAEIAAAGNTIAGAATGDPACCEAFEKWLAVLTKGADSFVRAGSPLASLSELLGATLSNLLADFGALLDGTGVVEILGGCSLGSRARCSAGSASCRRPIRSRAMPSRSTSGSMPPREDSQGSSQSR